jgi:hypothetical protein
MRLPPRIKTRLDARLQTRLSSAIHAVSRYLRRNEGLTDYIDIPAFSASGEIKVSMLFETDATHVGAQGLYYFGKMLVRVENNNSIRVWGDSANVNAHFSVPDIGGKLHSVTIIQSTISTDVEVILNGVSLGVKQGSIANPAGSSYFNIGRHYGSRLHGYVADFEIQVNNYLIRNYPIDEESGSIVIDTVSGQNGTVVDGLDSDRSAYSREGDDWVRDAILYPSTINYMSNWDNPLGWNRDSDTGITVLDEGTNPTGVDLVGVVEQVGTGTAILSQSARMLIGDGDTIYQMCVVKVVNFDMDLSFYIYDVPSASFIRVVMNVATGVLKQQSNRWIGEVYREQLPDGYWLLGIGHTSDAGWSDVYGNFRLRVGSLGLPPVGSKIMMQSVFFGQASDWPVITEDRLVKA